MNNKIHSSKKETIRKLLVGSFSVFMILTLIAPAWAVVFTNAGTITINDATAIGTGNPYPSNITVAGMTGNITNVTLRLGNINHTFPDDLDVMLVAPNGSNLLVMSDVGGSDDAYFRNLTIDDAAATLMTDAAGFASGSYQPTNIGAGDTFPAPAPTPGANTTLAAAFNGIAANGVWSLYVVDDLGVDTGTIGDGWSLTVTTAGSLATTFTNGTPISGGDGARGRATPYSSVITTSGLTGAITDVKVTLTNVNHLNPDDLDILLIAPSGKRILLLSDAGGTTDVVNATITFDDAAAATVPDAGPLVAGTFKPTDFGTGDTMPDFPGPYPNSATAGTTTLASVFDGTEPNGAWQLVVVDDATTSDGSIMGGWSIDVTAGGTYGAKRFTSSDFDGDGKTDTSVYRPSDRMWYLRDSTAYNNRYQNFGAANDLPIPGDYDGDRKTDIAVFRPGSGQWFILRSGTGTLESIQFGASTDQLVPADYDGDGRTDAAVWRPATGVWYIRQSNGGGATTLRSVQWGATGDVPVRGNFEGTNGADFTVFRPGTGVWYIRNNAETSARAVQFGASGDILTPGDYDGDGKTDIALWRPSEGNWYNIRSSNSVFTGQHWGSTGDVPTPGDYDGDSITDIAIWRPSFGGWYILNSGTPATGASVSSLRADSWGGSNDYPLPATYNSGP